LFDRLNKSVVLNVVCYIDLSSKGGSMFKIPNSFIVTNLLLTFFLNISSSFAAPKGPLIIEPHNNKAPVELSLELRRNVLIIGGGLAGMSAALELAERGYQVTLKEADSVLGGKLNTKEVEIGELGKFKVEHGLHMWFDNYHNFKDIRNRLGINNYFRPYKEVHYLFRNYEPEVISSRPPIYPLNLLNLIRNSPNLKFLDALTQLRMMVDLAFFNYDSLSERFDNMTLREWADKSGINDVFYDVVFYPAATVTLNDPKTISAYEMLNLTHLCFMGQPKAMNREITTEDHGTAVINPWEKKLLDLGVKIEKNHYVQGLRVEDNKVIGEIGDEKNYDYVIMAAGVKGTKAIIKGSLGQNLSDDFRSLASQVDQLKIAPPYKVVRVWFDKKTNADRADLYETPEHSPVVLFAQFHMLEEESRKWAEKSGGSVIEFHLYNIPMWEKLSDDEVMKKLRPTIFELLPELKESKVLGFNVNSYHNFTSYEVGQNSIRPYVDTAETDYGISNLFFAGDFVNTLYPSALMEKAVSTGREAANSILIKDGVRQVELTVTSKYGPGIPFLPL
jgi:isorenieratene synthase